VYKVFQYLKHPSILNGSNLDGNIFIFNLFFFFKFENLVFFLITFWL
jgi:hypothetical protein